MCSEMAVNQRSNRRGKVSILVHNWYNKRVMDTKKFSRIIRLPEVLGATQLSRATIYRLLGSGEFPRPIKLSERAVGWRRDEVETWIATRERANATNLRFWTLT